MRKIAFLFIALIALASKCQATGKPTTTTEQTEQEAEAECREGTLAATRGNLELLALMLAKAEAPANFDKIVGRAVVVSPHDLPGDFHFYKVTGGAVQISGGGSLLLTVECGSKFRGWAIRELKFNFGHANHGWSVGQSFTTPLTPNSQTNSSGTRSQSSSGGLVVPVKNAPSPDTAPNGPSRPRSLSSALSGGRWERGFDIFVEFQRAGYNWFNKI